MINVAKPPPLVCGLSPPRQGCFFIALAGGELSLCLAPTAGGPVSVHHRFWTGGPCLAAAIDPAKRPAIRHESLSYPLPTSFQYPSDGTLRVLQAGGLLATVSSIGPQPTPAPALLEVSRMVRVALCLAVTFRMPAAELAQQNRFAVSCRSSRTRPYPTRPASSQRRGDCPFTALPPSFNCPVAAPSLPFHGPFTAFSLHVHRPSTALRRLFTALPLTFHCHFIAIPLPVHCPLQAVRDGSDCHPPRRAPRVARQKMVRCRRALS